MEIQKYPAPPKITEALKTMGLTDIKDTYLQDTYTNSHSYFNARFSGYEVTVEVGVMDWGETRNEVMFWIHYPERGNVVAVGIVDAQGRPGMFHLVDNDDAYSSHPFSSQAIRPREYDYTSSKR